jgi:hypothetical protein
MPNPILGIAAASAVGTIGSAVIGSKQASKAAKAQVQSNDAAIAEQRAAREQLIQLLKPYTDAGIPALQEMLALTGLGGSEAEAAAVSRIEEGDMFQALARQGEDAILQNASATGGLRGGNVQGALAQFRPSLLNQFIQQQYGRLAGLTELGQNSAAGVGNAGLGVANSIGQIQMDSGAARAGNSLAQGQIFSNAFGNLAGLIAGQLGGGGPKAATF